jgi:hypothetical protein
LLTIAERELGGRTQCEEDGFEQRCLTGTVVTDDHIDAAAISYGQVLETPKVLEFDGSDHEAPLARGAREVNSSQGDSTVCRGRKGEDSDGMHKDGGNGKSNARSVGSLWTLGLSHATDMGDGSDFEAWLMRR